MGEMGYLEAQQISKTNAYLVGLMLETLTMVRQSLVDHPNAEAFKHEISWIDIALACANNAPTGIESEPDPR